MKFTVEIPDKDFVSLRKKMETEEWVHAHDDDTEVIKQLFILEEGYRQMTVCDIRDNVEVTEHVQE